MDILETYKKRADKIKKEFAEVQLYAASNFDAISKTLEADVAETKYLVGATLLGRYIPDYLDEYLTRGFKKGKLCNSFPNKDCDTVYLDKAGKLLYMRQNCIDPRYNHDSYYKVDFDGYTYFLYRDFRDNEFAPDGHPASFRAKYDDKNRIIEFLLIQLNCYFHSRKYTYSADGMITCIDTAPYGLEKVIISNYSFFLENGKVRDLKQFQDGGV